MKIEMLPINKLVPSAANVRKTHTGQSIDELAASVAALGLLQNLQVASSAKGKFAVVAGGRRLAALRLLVKRDEIAANTKVPCNILGDDDNETEISLAENVIRENMHPADQFEAFSKMAESGQSPDDIAARFGVSSLVVKQRLKLAAVSPKLMQAYRDGDMTLEHLMAFTVSDDHAAQETAWRELPDWNRNPNRIREHLTRAQVRDTDRRVKFVTLDAYKAAGGVILSDLFEDDCYLQDVALLDRLCAERLAAEAEAVKAEGWKWVEIAADADYGTLQPYQRQRGKHQPTAKQEKLLAKLQAEYDELSQKDEYTDEESDRAYALEEEIEDLKAACLAFSDRQKAQGGAIVALDGSGAVQIVRGLIAASDVKAAKQEAEDDTAATDEVTEDATTGLSAKLASDLTEHRTMALRALVADQPITALVTLLHLMVQPIYYEDRFPESALDIRPVLAHLQAAGIDDSRAAKRLHQLRDRWTLPEDVAELAGWLKQQDLNTLVSILAVCVAQTVKPERTEATDQLAAAVGLDMTQWFEPTVANYLGRVSKPQILEAVTEGVSPAAADNIKTLKKGEMALKAEELLTGKGWTPVILR